MTQTQTKQIVRIKPFKLRDGQVFAQGYEQLKEKIAIVPGVTTTVTVGRNQQTGKIETGLEEQEARELEKLLNLKENELAPTSDFWRKFRVRIPDVGLTLKMENPNERLILAVLKASDEVAPSSMDRGSEGGRYLGARFYIDDPEAESKYKLDKFELEDKAVSEYTNLDSEMKRRVSRILGCLLNSNGSDLQVKTNLREFIAQNDSNKYAFLDVVKRNHTDIIVTDEVMEAIELQILKKKRGGSIIFNFEGKDGDFVGENFEKAVEYFSDPRNSDVRKELRESIKRKKNK